eukprot:scaffold346_cov116-Cylindrotheca_fusiformis.AAC.40
MTELTSDKSEIVVGNHSKQKKKTGKDKKRKRNQEENPAPKDAPEEDLSVKQPDQNEVRRDLRRKEREARRRRKEELLAQVPQADEDGIKYTKIQTKRMMKRVKRGLPPVPTEAEENERLRNEAELRREDEAELAGLVYRKEDEDEQEETVSDAEETDTDGKPGSEEKAPDELAAQEEQTVPNSTKKAKRSKPVPPDYVCQACKNRHGEAHWIYDCPDKVTVRGTNKKAKKLRGLHDPQPRKVFVSGLPFEVKPADVSGLFKSCGKVVSCKLVKFDDTGRCNGQAYITFDTNKGAEEALKLSGMMIDNGLGDESKKKSKKSGESPKRKQLKLKVSKAVNRQRHRVEELIRGIDHVAPIQECSPITSRLNGLQLISLAATTRKLMLTPTS